jgi:hypothetical protein
LDSTLLKRSLISTRAATSSTRRTCQIPRGRRKTMRSSTERVSSTVATSCTSFSEVSKQTIYPSNHFILKRPLLTH